MKKSPVKEIWCFDTTSLCEAKKSAVFLGV